MKRGHIVLLLLILLFVTSISGLFAVNSQINITEIDTFTFEDIISSPSEDTFVYIASSEAILFDVSGKILATQEFPTSHPLDDLNYAKWTPDGEHIIFRGNFGGSQEFFLADATTLEIEQSFTGYDILGSVGFDGDFYIDNNLNLKYHHNGSIWSYNLLTSQNSQLINITSKIPSESWVAFSPSGNHILYQITARYYKLYNLNTHEVINFISNYSQNISFNPSNTEIAVYNYNNNSIYIYDYQNNITYPQFNLDINFIYGIQWSKTDSLLLNVISDIDANDNYEANDKVEIYNYRTGEINWQHSFNKGIVYDASISYFLWLSTKNTLVLGDRSHDPPQLLVLDLSNRSQFQLEQLSMNVIGIIFALLITVLILLKKNDIGSVLQNSLARRKETPDSRDETAKHTLQELKPDKIDVLDQISLYLTLSMIGITTADLNINNQETENFAYPFTKSVIHALFAFSDIILMGLLTLAILSLFRQDLRKSEKIIIGEGYAFWIVITILMRYYQGFSFGDNTPFMNPLIVNILNTLRIYILFHMFHLKRIITRFDDEYNLRYFWLLFLLIASDILLVWLS